jgi:hypothetical protein
MVDGRIAAIQLQGFLRGKRGLVQRSPVGVEPVGAEESDRQPSVSLGKIGIDCRRTGKKRRRFLFHVGVGEFPPL